jgi:hypothetical protein
MSSLEQRLYALGQELAFPPEPDLASAARYRAAGRPFPWRGVALAAAVLAVALAAAFAVPQARTTILRWFHIQGATVERVETLPAAQERSSAGGLGRRLTLGDAERRVGFHLLLPPLHGRPSVYVLDDALATVILRVGDRPVLLSEYVARSYTLLKKSVAEKSVVESVRVDGEPGLWVEGPPHTLTYFNGNGEFQQRTVKITGNVLLWTHGPVTLRLEGRISRAQALRLARRIG